jgi:carbamoyl-phosphate synthase large subunit
MRAVNSYMSPPQKRYTVLLTGAGGPAISGMIQILQSDFFKVVAVDMDQFSSGFYSSDVAYVVPPGDDPKFLDRLQEICLRESVDAIISVVDEELPHVAAMATKGVAVIQPELNFVNFALDKFVCMVGLRENGINAPQTWMLSDLPSDVRYPLFIKPRRGRGSRGCCKVDTPLDLEFFLNSTSYTPDQLLAQEFVDGIEYTVSVLVSRDGSVGPIIPKEIICKRGVTRIAVARHNFNIEMLCKEIQHKFKANGPFNVQLILDSHGEPWIFEINPRFSTSTTLTNAVGINEVKASLMNALEGVDLPSNQWEDGLVLVRSTMDMFLTEEEFMFCYCKLST